HEARKKPPQLVETLAALEPDGQGRQEYQETVRDRNAAHKQGNKNSQPAYRKRNIQLPQSKAHHSRSHERIGNTRPVEIAAGHEELLIDRLEQVEIEVAGANQVGKFA